MKRQLGMTILAAALVATTTAGAAATTVHARNEPIQLNGRIRTGGITRTWTLVRPSVLPVTGRVPLIVLLHGGYGTGANVLRQGNWTQTVATGGFIVVAPDGLFRAWNAGGCCGYPMTHDVDDVAFIRQLVRTLESELPIDTGRVFATGISNGGMMTYRLGCEASDIFAAIAPVSATLFTTTPCRPSQRLSVLHIHGLADQNVPFAGGVGPAAVQRNPPDYPPVLDGVQRWAAIDGCRVRLPAAVDGGLTTTRWAGCRNRTTVELITIAGGGHSWPGGQRMAAILDPPSTTLDATATIVSFFAAHHR